MRYLMALLLVTPIACVGTATQAPPSGPGTSYPCGIDGHECLNMAGTPNGACCGNWETCGGGKYSVGCPADMCCDIGTDGTGVRLLKPPHPQWKIGETPLASL